MSQLLSTRTLQMACRSALAVVPFIMSWAAPAFAVQITFQYTGSIHSFVVPMGVTQVMADAAGAQGGSGDAAGGLGARVQTTFGVTPGELLYIFVGGAGTNSGGSGQPGVGGFNGGADGGQGLSGFSPTGSFYGGGGGGASDIRQGGSTLAERIVVAAGGGGGGIGGNHLGVGGAGGGPIGLSGTNGEGALAGGGGTQGAGGVAGISTSGGSPGFAGSLGMGGIGGGCSSNGRGGGGGGGGFYGGGGGGGACTTGAGGGGGGSSFAVGAPIYTSGFQATNGYVIFDFTTIPVPGAATILLVGFGLIVHTCASRSRR